MLVAVVVLRQALLSTALWSLMESMHLDPFPAMYGNTCACTSAGSSVGAASRVRVVEVPHPSSGCADDTVFSSNRTLAGPKAYGLL